MVKGADVHIHDCDQKDCASYVAVYVEVVQMMLNAGENIHAVDMQCNARVDTTASSGRFDVMLTLMRSEWGY